MKNGYMFFLNLGNIARKARILVIPVIALSFVCMLFAPIPLFVISVIAAVICIALSIIHAPHDDVTVRALKSFYSNFENQTCEKSGLEKQEIAFLRGWQIKGKSIFRRYVGENFVFPYPVIMGIYQKDGKQYFCLSTMSLLCEDSVQSYECRVDDEHFIISVSRIAENNDEEMAVHLKFPNAAQTIDIRVDNTYQTREFTDLLINKVGELSIKLQGQGKRNKIEVSDITPVSRARSYGVTKNETFLTRFNDALSHWMLIAVKVFAIGILGVYVWFLLTLMGTIGTALYFVIVACFVWFVLLKRYKRRFKFFRQLKKYCKKNKCKLTFRRKFFDTFKYSQRDCDIVLESGVNVYFIRLLTVKKKNCAAMFDGKGHAQLIYPCPRDGQTVTFYDREMYDEGKYSVRTYETRNWGRMQIRLLDLNFGQKFSVLDGKAATKVLIVDPTPFAIHKRAQDGGTSRTGTGDTIEDFMLFTSRAFVEFLKRSENKK